MSIFFFLSSLSIFGTATIITPTAVAATTGSTTSKKYLYQYSWTKVAPMPLARSDASATTVGDKILLAGGCVGKQVLQNWGGYGCDAITKSATLFDPTTETFEAVPDMPRERYRHAATEVNGKVYLLGGTDLSYPEPQIALVDVFDAKSKTWSTLPSEDNLSPGAMTDPAAFAIGTKLYFVGGYETTTYNATNKVWSYDTATTEAKTGWIEVAEAPTKRGDSIGVTMGNKGYVFGGFTHENDWAMPVGHLESYDPSANRWESHPVMKTVRGDKAGAELHDRFHVIGGETKDENGTSVPIDKVEVFDPSDGTWQTEGDIPSERFRFMAASTKNKIYIFGGQGKLQGAGETSFYPVLPTVEAFVEKRTGITNVDGGSTRSTESVIASVFALLVAILVL